MFIRYDNGSVRMVTGIEPPADNSGVEGRHSWSVVVWLGGISEIHHFQEDELSAHHFFGLTRMQMLEDRLFTPEQWNHFIEYERPRFTYPPPKTAKSTESNGNDTKGVGKG